jgi:uncharacterized protein
MKKASRFKRYSNSTTYKIDAKESDYLYIGESQIPGSGKGLFTSIPLYRDEVISLFKGEFLSEKEARKRTITGADGYFINMPDGTILDSNQSPCFAKFANDASGIVKSEFKTNSKISLDEKGNVCITANRTISIDEEIFCRYGSRYWKKFAINL